MTIRYNPSLLLKELTITLVGLLIVISTVWMLNVTTGSSRIVYESLRLQDLWPAAVVLGLFIFASRFLPRIASRVLRIISVVVIWSGLQTVVSVWLSPLVAALLALFFVGVLLHRPTIVWHDLMFVTGLCGVAAMLGPALGPVAVALLLIIFSIYDLMLVYRTGDMVRMAQLAFSARVVPGVVVPSRWRDFLRELDTTALGHQMFFLGGGDLFIPLLLVAALVPVSLVAASVVGVGVLLGLTLTHIIFASQDERRPMAALPPIAAVTLVVYALVLLIL